MMELRKINLQDALSEWQFITEMPAEENGLENSHHGISCEEYVEKALPKIISYEDPVNMPDWFVPETIYYLWEEDTIVGEFRIRHHLTEALRNGAGHIGYSIRKELRGRGYGTAGLKLALEKAGEIVSEDEIYFRLNKDNKASQRVLEKNGAYVTGEDDKHLFMRIRKQ